MWFQITTVGTFLFLLCFLTNPIEGELFECSSPLGVESTEVVDTQASSERESAGIEYASLYSEKGWCAEVDDQNQYIQVDLGVVKIVTGIATRGHGVLSNWVTNYKIQYSFDGEKWFDYTMRYDDKEVIFAGNTDSNTTVIGNLGEDLVAKYIRVYPVSWTGSICMRLEILGCSPDCESYMGMSYEKGPLDIPDSAITASAWHGNHPHHAPVQARLFKVVGQAPSGGSGWAASSANDYLQVDLGRVTQLSGALTMGRGNHDQYVKTIAFSYSDNNVDWQEDGKVYTANHNFRQSLKVIKFDTVLYARYLRFHGKTSHTHLSLRAEVLGCKRAGKRDLGMASELIPDSQITASSYYTGNNGYNPQEGRLGIVRDNGCWATPSRTRAVGEYLQVYLGSKAVPITGIATRGRYNRDQAVRFFNVRFSNDSQAWTLYTRDGKNEELLSRGTDYMLIERIYFDRIFVAKYVRFVVKSWSGHASASIELYGFTGASPQIFDHSPGNITVAEYGDVTLKCRASGDDPMETKWFKGDELLQTTTSMDESDLLLSSLSGNDAGGYHCAVSNAHGKDSFSFRINVIAGKTAGVSMCLSYEDMNDITRRPGNKVEFDVTDDAVIRPEKWYTFSAGDGDEIPEKCIDNRRCGGRASGWLDGKTPTSEQGIVNRKICFNTVSSCCGASAKVLVRRCASHVVYKFYEGIPKNIGARVCVSKNTGSHSPAPAGIVTVDRDHALSGFTFDVISETPSVTGCTAHCLNTAACLSFNYSPNEAVCELNDAKKAKQISSYIPRPGFHYYEKENFVGGNSVLLF